LRNELVDGGYFASSGNAADGYQAWVFQTRYVLKGFFFFLVDQTVKVEGTKRKSTLHQALKTWNFLE
jgi:hypothetical protein